MVTHDSNSSKIINKMSQLVITSHYFMSEHLTMNHFNLVFPQTQISLVSLVFFSFVMRYFVLENFTFFVFICFHGNFQ